MTVWIIYGVWAGAALLLWRRCVWAVTSWETDGGTVDGEDVILGLLFGTCLAAAWPLYLIGKGAPALWRAHSNGISSLLEPRHVRRERELSARRWELADREQRIRDLERELGVGSSSATPFKGPE